MAESCSVVEVDWGCSVEVFVSFAGLASWISIHIKNIERFSL